VIPIIGEIGTGGACLADGILGGFGGGAAGAWLGDRTGTAAYDDITKLEWS
jgi:NaMN:DMB phosphoribosyltransferase